MLEGISISPQHAKCDNQVFLLNKMLQMGRWLVYNTVYCIFRLLKWSSHAFDLLEVVPRH